MSDFRMFFGAASGSDHIALRAFREPNVMCSYATKENIPKYDPARLFVDSGAYSVVPGEGDYQTGVEEYLDHVEEVDADLFALRDYPCEEGVLDDLGRSVEEHQNRTTDAHIRVLDAFEARDMDATPVAVLQGRDADDYLDHLDRMRDMGLVRATGYVGIGTLCGRDDVEEIGEIIRRVGEATDARLHAFGVKVTTFRETDALDYLSSADSLAYSSRTRRRERSERWTNKAGHYSRMRAQIDDLVGEGRVEERSQRTLDAVGGAD